MIELQHINVKIPVAGEMKADAAKLVAVFHRWVSEQALDELLVDVADYRHVPDGPGVLLIGLQADYSLDQTAGRLGLRYNRKAALDGSNLVRMLQALGAASKVCARLEKELAGQLAFERSGFELFVNDRALAPNTPETFAACKADLDALCEKLGGGEARYSSKGDPRQRFAVAVKLNKPLEFEKIPG